MRRTVEGGYELDDDPARVDVDAAHAFLTASYWAEGRTRETVERLVHRSARVVGAYRSSEMVGFCRIESDEVTFAFLLDVFVVPEHRGRGLGGARARGGGARTARRSPVGSSAPGMPTRSTNGSASGRPMPSSR